MGTQKSRTDEIASATRDYALRTDVVVENDDWYNLSTDPTDLCVAAADTVFGEARTRSSIDAFGGGHYEVSVALTTDHRIRELNRDYRHRDMPTNVLSFAALDGDPPAAVPADAPVLLGDIVVAFETVKHEACAQGKSVEDHLAHMIAHGMLHLLGFDHVTEGDASVMESLEKKSLDRLGVADPYEAPAPGPTVGNEP